MHISNEILIPLLSLLFFFLGWLVAYLVKKGKEKSPQVINYVDIALELIENFIRANPELINKSWKSFYTKIQKWIEKNLKIDLTEEQWKLINEKLLELYEKLKSELKTEQSQ